MNRHQRIVAVVRRIPRGKVATYGQVAALAQMPRYARLVGFALHQCPPGVPWQRVINARGEISLSEEDGQATFQRVLLEAEGVMFQDGRVDLRRFGWKPGGQASQGRRWTRTAVRRKADEETRNGGEGGGQGKDGDRETGKQGNRGR